MSTEVEWPAGRMGFDPAFLEEIGIVPFVAAFDLLRDRQVKVLHSPAPSGRAGGDEAEQLLRGKQQLKRLLPHLFFCEVFELI